MLDRFYHPPNKGSKFLLLSLKKFYDRKEAWAMQKLFIKKNSEKMDMCLRYQNNGYLDARLKKRDE